jgi:hypothetical protein
VKFYQLLGSHRSFQGNTQIDRSNLPQLFEIVDVLPKLIQKSRENLRFIKRMIKRLFYLGSSCLFLGITAISPVAAVPQPHTETAQLLDEEVSVTDAPQITLLNPGAEPRQQLLLQPEAGETQTTTATIYLDVASAVGGQPVSRTILPETVLTKETTVMDVADTGDITTESVYTGAIAQSRQNLNPKVLQGMQAMVEGVKDFRSETIVDARRQLKSSQTELPPTLNTQMQGYFEGMSDSLSQMALPLPEEEVGIGAMWQVESEYNLNGIPVNQVIAYELVHLDDGVATLDVDIESTGTPTSVTLRNTPVEATAMVESFMTEGQGRIVMDLNQVMPIVSSVAVNSEVDMMVQAPGMEEMIPVQRSMYMNVLTEDTESPIAKTLLPAKPGLENRVAQVATKQDDDDDLGAGEGAAYGAAAGAVAGLLTGDLLGDAATGAAVGAGLSLL